MILLAMHGSEKNKEIFFPLHSWKRNKYIWRVKPVWYIEGEPSWIGRLINNTYRPSYYSGENYQSIFFDLEKAIGVLCELLRGYFMEITRTAMERHKVGVTVVGCFLVVLLAVIDDITGHEFRVSLLYIVPVVIVALLVGKWGGIYMSVLSAISWLIVDLRSEFVYSVSTVHIWNAVVRIAFFFFVTYGIYLLVLARRKQQELIYFIIHDLKTPLTSIMVGLHTIRDFAGDSVEQTQKLAPMLLNSCNRMSIFIDSLVDLSILEEGKYKPNLEEVNVKVLIDRSVELVSLWAEKSKIAIEERIDTDQTTINTDKLLTIRILTNLVSNAIKVSPADSKITIRVTKTKENNLSFSISDQGPGIHPKWQSRIFDKFYHVDAQKEGAYIGSGLGLTFCNLAVKQLGGHIKLLSELDKGTTVTFEIPV